MKKLMVAMLTLALVAALALSALAVEGDVRYVNRSKLNVYKEWDTDSKVVKTLKGGDKIVVEDYNMQGSWGLIHVKDSKGKTRQAFVQTKYLSDAMPQDYCTHHWGKWKVTKAATCTEEGKRERKCSICGKKQTETVKAAGHDWGKWKVTKAATCVKKGTRTRTCQVCGKKETEEFYDEHTYGAWTMTKEPTCTKKGEREHTCKVCGRVETQALEKLPHEYEWKVIVETTDHSAGKRAKVCVNCGYQTGAESFDPEGTLRRGSRGEAVRAMQQLLVEQGYLNAGSADGIFGGGSEKALMQYQQDRGLNPDGVAWPQTLKDLEHDFGPWETEKEMTRTEDGIRVRVCQGCGFEQKEIIESGTVLEKGARGEDIRTLQQLVKQLGYDAGGFDGIYGKKLDAAMAGFAAAHDIAVEEGEIRPADVDAVVNAWLKQVSAGRWKGEGEVGSPVNLALTVTPTGEADDSGIVTYSWSLTNLGDDSATFTALLLSFGDAPDFKHDVLVMQLDGQNLKGNSGNSASGSFSASEKWGEGSLNFAALALDATTDLVWLSNTVEYENSLTPAAKTVAPRAAEVNVNALADGVYPVAFNPGDVLKGASGIFINAAAIYSEDVYDPAEVNALAVGDTLIVSGEAVAVKTVENVEGSVAVNGGLDSEDGVVLAPLDEEGSGYRVALESDLPTYTQLGVTTLTLDESAVFNDSWDIEGEPVSVGYDGIVEAVTGSENTYFSPYNTTVRVEGGKVVELTRVYVP